MPTVEEMINMRESLTRTQLRIFEYFLQYPEVVCYATLRDVSQKIGVSEVSVINLSRKLGCTGFAEMKQVFRLYTEEKMQKAYKRDYTLETVDESASNDRRAVISSMFEAERASLFALDASVSEEDIISCARELLRARQVLLFGHDVSKVMADYFAHRLNYLRIRAASIKLGDSDAVKTGLVTAGRDDVIVLFSFPPYYKQVSNVARYAEYCGAKLITITDSPDSPAVLKDAINFYCSTKTKFFFNSLTAPISLINILTSYTALEMGEALNRILDEELRVSRIMNGEPETETEIKL